MEQCANKREETIRTFVIPNFIQEETEEWSGDIDRQRVPQSQFDGNSLRAAARYVDELTLDQMCAGVVGHPDGCECMVDQFTNE
ncbi:MAG: hypothetical protein ABIR91_00430 [Candidatus Saccharimonadales bacterium]